LTKRGRREKGGRPTTHFWFGKGKSVPAPWEIRARLDTTQLNILSMPDVVGEKD